MLLIAVFSSWVPLAKADSVAAIAEREIARRQANVERAEQLLSEGRKALSFKEYEKAYVHFLDAVELLPPALDNGRPRRAAVNEFSRAAMEYANWLVQQGRYEDAEKVAKTVLLPEFNPTYRPAVAFLSKLEQPNVFNKTLTPEFAAKRDQVNKLFQEAEGFYISGRYDLAARRYNQILELDPYNEAARRGLEQVENRKQEYYQSSYDETRSRFLWQVTKSWEIPPEKTVRREASAGPQQETRGTEAILTKLNRIIIPRINLEDTTLREAVSFLQQQSIRLDTTGDESRRGVNIVLQLAQQAQPGQEQQQELQVSPNTRITLQLTNVPLSEALRYVAELAGLRVKVEPFAVTLVPLSVPIDTLVTREFRVPPDFIPFTKEDAPQAFVPRGQPQGPRSSLTGTIDAQKFLQDQGIKFPQGASATYYRSGSKLIVKNTQDNIDQIEALVNAATGVQEKQVEIQTKFIEISQNNLEELGFDFLMGPFSLNGVAISGGDPSYPNTGNYPFNLNLPSITSGLRRGEGNNIQSATLPNNVDSLLQGTLFSPSPTPGIFGIAGIFTNPQFEVVIRALSQKKGVDLLASPSVTTKPGQEAVVRVARKFYYPTSYDPPQISQTATGDGGAQTANIDPRTVPAPPIVPSFPSAYAEQYIGVMLTVTPEVQNDNYTIDLRLKPEVIDFEGFINYGSEINTVGWSDGFGVGPDGLNLFAAFPRAIVLTENKILQPVFSVRRVTTNVKVWDGQTVAIGGLIREDGQKVQDKVPILGDVPIAGRLFRATVDKKIKKNLLIFVSPRLLDTEGKPLRREEVDEEEIVDPLGLPAPIRPTPPLSKGSPRLK
ncbi:MAG: type II and III secretion system protein [Chthoniobacterales bacterium]|nr:type II and III secretion system protein [Chthoniobacterales bacterium]